MIGRILPAGEGFVKNWFASFPLPWMAAPSPLIQQLIALVSGRASLWRTIAASCLPM